MQTQNIGLAKVELLKKFGAGQKERIDRGVDQLASIWREHDGSLVDFVRKHFIGDERKLADTFQRLESVFEQLDGHFLEISRELRRATDLDTGPLLDVDPLLSELDPSSHLTEDLFKSKIGFVVLLNFPLTTLRERLANSRNYTRQQWAELRLANRFARRVPAEVQQAIAEAGSKADLYIAEYNLWMHHLLGEKGERLFPRGLRLISHWNLRDELRGDYADPKGIDKQRLIVKVMERIVTQSIPAAVINNPRLDWNPFTNEVRAAPASEVEETSAQVTAKADASPEPNTRYTHLLNQFRAHREEDRFSPVTPTQIARSFEVSREIPEERVIASFKEVLTSSLVSRVAAMIQKRLGRPLQPQDIWYNGFQPRGKYSEAELDALCQKRYPTREAFASDIPRILEALGFDKQKAKFVSEHIVVDAARGAGHAMPAARRGDFPHLRTRVGSGGMNYKGYNIAVHELGHNVEQVFSLYEVDHTLLSGVPNNAFTEALAFVFQARDLELLGLSKSDPESETMKVLNDFWQTWEIAGVALVDIGVWHWMYDHPDANPAQLKEATVRISQQIWNQYYSSVVGAKDSALLGIYSHMIAYPLYLADYPLGHLIAFQIEESLKKKGNFGAEFERMAKFGSVAPDTWMINATGAPVEAAPLLRATANALDKSS